MSSLQNTTPLVHYYDSEVHIHTLVTIRKRSCGKVMFLHLSVSHSVHWGGGGVHRPGQTRHPLGRHPAPPPQADTTRPY